MPIGNWDPGPSSSPEEKRRQKNTAKKQIEEIKHGDEKSYSSMRSIVSGERGWSKAINERWSKWNIREAARQNSEDAE